jgi:UDP-N-acetylglucosamine 2-epimerase (hydrolysing)
MSSAGAMSSGEARRGDRHVCFLTGTRADFGKLKPLIVSAAEVDGIRVTVLVTGMHLMEKYGSTVIEVRRLEPLVDIREFANQDEGDTMDRVLARTVSGLSEVIDQDRPDLLVVHGDRVEALGGAAAGALRNVAVAHVEGGEVSGTIDGVLRHAISKLSHLHLVANDEAERRVLQLGEDPDTVWAIGSPDIDVMLSDTLPPLEQVLADYEIPFDDYLLVVLHGVTTEDEGANAAVAAALVDVLLARDERAVVVHPNNDPGSDAILARYDSLRGDPRFRVFPSLRFEAFLTLLRNARALVGNSSAGIREAPIYGVPSVDIGSRQRGRAQHPTIVHCGATVDEIDAALTRAELAQREPSRHFGRGDSARRFAELLAGDEIWARGVDKVFRDLLSDDD